MAFTHALETLLAALTRERDLFSKWQNVPGSYVPTSEVIYTVSPGGDHAVAVGTPDTLLTALAQARDLFSKIPVNLSTSYNTTRRGCLCAHVEKAAAGQTHMDRHVPTSEVIPRFGPGGDLAVALGTMLAQQRDLFSKVPVPAL